MRIKHPEPGTRRIKRSFAFLPVTIEYETRWLEIVTTAQVFKEYCGRITWINVEFID